MRGRYQRVTKHFSYQYLPIIEYRHTEIEQDRGSHMSDPNIFRALQRMNVETQILYFLKYLNVINQASKFE